MINSISSAHTSNVESNTQPLAQSAASQKQKTSSAPEDTVTLKSAGDADHDGDSK